MGGGGEEGGKVLLVQTSSLCPVPRANSSQSSSLWDVMIFRATVFERQSAEAMSGLWRCRRSTELLQSSDQWAELLPPAVAELLGAGSDELSAGRDENRPFSWGDVASYFDRLYGQCFWCLQLLQSIPDCWLWCWGLLHLRSWGGGVQNKLSLFYFYPRCFRTFWGAGECWIALHNNGNVKFNLACTLAKQPSCVCSKNSVVAAAHYKQHSRFPVEVVASKHCLITNDGLSTLPKWKCIRSTSSPKQPELECMN